ncbi:MAG: trehalose-6-phosphate synthase [Actinomycetota bacterium]
MTPPSPGPDRPLLVASNRGPRLRTDAGVTPTLDRSAGGLAAALTDLLQDVGGTWVASAMSPWERDAAAAGPMETEDGPRVRFVAVDPETFDGFYNGLANRVLWFCHHRLWDVPTAPAFGEGTARAWAAYREVNRAFARAHVEEAARADPAFLVQDYHLCLVPELLRERRPGARVAYFSHIPFAEPAYLGILPDAMREALLRGMLGADLVGFHAAAWARAFLDACRGLPGVRVDARRGTVAVDGRTVRVEANPISIDGASLRERAASPEIRERLDGHRHGEERLIFRADRMELSKNIVRGFAAYERLLETRPEWRGRVRFLAHVYPSREALPEYAAYAEACRAAADRVNERFTAANWTPLELVVRDDFEEVLAGFVDYDVLLVNPVADGLNLVAKEGPAVNERDGVLVLSRRAGAFDELGRHALGVNPFDLEETAAALHQALEMPAAERRKRARGLRRTIEARPPRAWAERQLQALSEG